MRTALSDGPNACHWTLTNWAHASNGPGCTAPAPYSKLIGAPAMPEIYGDRPMAALMAVHALRALSWAHGCVWGAAGGCRMPPQRVDIPNKARFS